MNTRNINLIFLSFIYQFPDSWCDLNSIKIYESNKNELSNFSNVWLLTSRKNASNALHKKFNNFLNQAKEEKEKNLKFEIHNETTNNLYRHRNLKFELKVKQVLPILLKHICVYGKAKIKRTVQITNKYLNLTTKVMPDLDEIKKEYTDKLKEYYKVMSEIKKAHNIEHNLVLFDAVEACNNIFSTTMFSLLSDILSTNEDYLKDYKHVVKLFRKAMRDEKRDNFMYICRTFSVCRHYPAFSDYVADLLTELLMYSSTTITTAATTMKEVIRNNSDYLKTLVDDDTAQIIGYQFQSSVRNFPDTNVFICSFTSMIRNRFQLFRSIQNSHYVSNQTKAFELLIYVIDETIQPVATDHVIEFNDIKIKINAWSRKKSVDLFDVFKTFWGKIIGDMKRRWNQAIRETVKALIEILVHGYSKNSEIGMLLLTEGIKDNIRFSDNGLK